MKNLKLKGITLIVMLLSVLGFSQALQPKPIQLDNKDGVFITIDLMDSISLKLIERNSLNQENKVLKEVVDNINLQNRQLLEKFELSQNQSLKFRSLYDISELQKTKALESLEEQKIITKNVKKKHLKTVFYISEGVFRSVLSDLPC